MKKKFIKFTLLVLILTVVITGCGKKKKEVEDTGPKVVEITRVGDFDGDIAVVSNNQTYYVVDQNLRVLSTHTSNVTYLDGYTISKDPEDRKKFRVLNTKGEEVFSYTSEDFISVTLVDNGCLITQRKDDKWDSSKTVYGVYSLEQKKYVLEESDAYSAITPYGDNMIALDSKKTQFFNTQTLQKVTYKVAVSMPFQDGYATATYVDSKKRTYLDIFADTGAYERVKIPYLDDENKQLKERVNNQVFLQSCTVKGETKTCQSAIVDLPTKKVIDLGTAYHEVTNIVHFTKEGYALLVFTNEGGTYYYTVINSLGNQAFEPVKCSTENRYLSSYDATLPQVVEGNYYEGNYFITRQNGEYKVIDKENKVVTTSSEYESFDGITNGYIKVKSTEPGRSVRFYYKNMSGEQVEVTQE